MTSHNVSATQKIVSLTYSPTRATATTPESCSKACEDAPTCRSAYYDTTPSASIISCFLYTETNYPFDLLVGGDARTNAIKKIYTKEVVTDPCKFNFLVTPLYNKQAYFPF